MLKSKRPSICKVPCLLAMVFALCVLVVLWHSQLTSRLGKENGWMSDLQAGRSTDSSIDRLSAQLGDGVEVEVDEESDDAKHDDDGDAEDDRGAEGGPDDENEGRVDAEGEGRGAENGGNDGDSSGGAGSRGTDVKKKSDSIVAMAGKGEGKTSASTSQEASGFGALPPAIRAAGEEKLVIAVASTLSHLDGTLVVFNSAIRHSKTPNLFAFRVITLESDLDPLRTKLEARLASKKDVDIDLAVVSFEPWVPRVSRLIGGGSSLREELNNVLNFAAFYLHEVFGNDRRVLYLDTDVVVLQDLHARLHNFNMGGNASASAKDCSQRVGKYIHFDRIKKKKEQIKALVAQPILAKSKTCVRNRGVVLVDVRRWAAANITGAIEALVKAHLNASIGPLWRSGVSQPPFLLATAGRDTDLGAEFNVRGLGRKDIAPDEIKFYKDAGRWSKYFSNFLRPCEFDCCAGCKGYAMTPFLSPLAHEAAIVHFNGNLKPFQGGRRVGKPLSPPADIEALSDDEKKRREKVPLCSCGPQCVQECAAIWWDNMPDGP